MQLIRQFEVSTPGVRVEYTEFNTSELYPEIRRGDSPADVVISSAMDLQAKLVNSGLAHAFRPANAGNVPPGRNGATSPTDSPLSPSAMVYNRAAFAQRELPRKQRPARRRLSAGRLHAPHDPHGVHSQNSAQQGPRSRLHRLSALAGGTIYHRPALVPFATAF